MNKAICLVKAGNVQPPELVPPMTSRSPNSAFGRAFVHQAPGSLLRLVRFRGGDIVYDQPDQLVLSMGVSASFGLNYAGDGRRGSVIPVINRFGLLPPGQRFHIGMRGDCVILQLVIPGRLVAGWLAEDWGLDGDRTTFAPAHGADDTAVSELIWSAWRAGPAEEATMLRAAAARLYRRFSPGAKALHAARGGLPAHKLRRVIELIEDDPARRLTVEDLAREAAISPFHFAHQFQAATGRAPHRFIVDRRLSRAVGLLGDTRLSIADVAMRCGFAQGSHLSRQMRRVLGQSPAELRRAMLI